MWGPPNTGGPHTRVRVLEARDRRRRVDDDRTMYIDLNHVITGGMETYPGLPGPRVDTFLSRAESERWYGSGVTFHIGLVTICTNTGTYIDVPFHRFAEGADLSDLPLDRVMAVPGVRLDGRGRRAIELAETDLERSAGRAVLVWTGHDRHFGTDAYANGAPFLTAASARGLVEAGAVCVGIDSVNIDDIEDLDRPVHTTLLGAGIPVVEHLTNLAALPDDGFAFTALPPRIEGAGTFSVRAVASVPGVR